MDISQASAIYYGDQPVSAVYYGSNEIWSNTPTPHDYSRDYFTIVSNYNNNDISWCTNNNSFKKSIYVSLDNGMTWTYYNTPTTTGVLIATLNEGEKMLVRGNNTAYATNIRHTYFKSVQSVNLEGNIMSLIYNKNFIGQTTLTETYTFAQLFTSLNIYSAENLILPATTLTKFCYNVMFQSQRLMSYGPKLLPANYIQERSYDGMFNGCIYLENAPEILASTADTYACYKMFNQCNKINYIKCLVNNFGLSTSFNNWVNGVSATGTFVKSSLNNSWPTGVDGIPSDWTVVNA